MFQRKGRRFECEVLFVKVNAIDNANNLVFWFRFLNKLEPWHIVYIMQQQQNTLNLSDRHQFPWLTVSIV